MIAGVCGGLGQYFTVDATILRLLWMAITIFSGVLPGVLVYILALIIMPKEPHSERSLQTTVIHVGGTSKKK